MISLSVVSHGQGALAASLLADLAREDWHDGVPFEVIVTLNLPEDERWLREPFPFPLTVIRNEQRRGFGANHNTAFHAARGDWFAVVNPDVRLAAFRIAPLLDALRTADAGVAGPLVLSPAGDVEDSARRFPTLSRLVARKVRPPHGPDYPPSPEAREVDWLAGMFLLFRSAVYRAIGGFDERYFMYMEDVEICRRLRRRGRRVQWVGATAVVHDAARASRRSGRHLWWHIKGLMRFLIGPARR